MCLIDVDQFFLPCFREGGDELLGDSELQGDSELFVAPSSEFRPSVGFLQ